MTPDLAEADRVLAQAAGQRAKKMILLSSALVYGTSPGRQSMVAENYAGSGDDPVAASWRSLERTAERHLQSRMALTVLRPATVVNSSSLLSRRLLSPIILTVTGHNPVIQLVSLSDLARAIILAAEAERMGTFNIAPDNVIPLHAAVRLANGHRLAVPYTLQRSTTRSAPLEYLRYPWTVSNQKAKRELGFFPEQSSLAALREIRSDGRSTPQTQPEFDEFGMDKAYIGALGRNLFDFLRQRYWRIATKGLEHLPTQGAGVLVGIHRGFMPWDAVMALHLIAREKGRFTRFLTHPGLFKFPFISTIIRKLGGVVACKQSADRVLENNDLLGVFPEGVRGAFSNCRDAYRLLPFGRNSFVKLALRHRAPIIPFVTVGSAEVFPIFAQIKSRAWTRYAGWPSIPISTFPFLPMPLPSKWHVQFLPPIHVHEQYSPEAAQDTATVKAISAEVRARMQAAVDEMVSRRRSVFFGSAFAPGDHAE